MAKKSSVQMSSYWEGKAPPSSVLGVGEKVCAFPCRITTCPSNVPTHLRSPFSFQIPSSVFGPLSALALVAGSYAIHESNIFNQVGKRCDRLERAERY